MRTVGRIMERLFHYALGALLLVAVIVVVFGLGAVGVYQVVQAMEPHHLATLQRVGSAPPVIGSGAYSLTGQHASRVIRGYEDLGTQPWRLWFQYQGCPTTRQGAFRLTVYKLGGQQAFGKKMPRNAEQITQTLVLWTPSGGGTYEHLGSEETSYFYKVDIPAKGGCVGWSLGSTGN